MLLIIEIVMLVIGLILLIAGKLKLGNINLEGAKARMVGLFLVLPLVLAFLFGFLIGVLISIGVLPSSAGTSGLVTIVEVILIIGGLVGAYLYAKK